MNHKSFFKQFLFFFFILYSSLMFCTAPQYVECSDLYPDEALDLFAIPNNSVTSSAILKLHPSVFSFSDFYPKAHTFQRLNSGKLYSRPFASELVLSVTLRC
jgi:hypothetical protein